MTLKNNRALQTGFGLIETMLAMLLLTAGLSSLAAMFTQGMLLMSAAQMDMIAKQKASEAIENVFSARDTRTLTWNRIRNVSDGGIFLNGPQPLYSTCTSNPPNDDIANTADDSSCPLERIVDAGPDGLLATADDRTIPLASFTREIEISDVAPNLRRVRVILRYRASRLAREYVLTTFFSAFS